MNQEKIGVFIATLRKNRNLTQAALAEKLGITDRAISKWERGKGIPDVSIMLELCDILGVTVNELLSGEMDSRENSQQLLLDMAKDIQEKNKMIWNSMWVILFVSIVALFSGIFFTAFMVPEGVLQVVIIIGLCLLFLPPCFYALKLEVSVGAYQCRHCGHEIVPTYKEALFAMHTGTTRYLKCPQCGKHTWAKKVLNK